MSNTTLVIVIVIVIVNVILSSINLHVDYTAFVIIESFVN